MAFSNYQKKTAAQAPSLDPDAKIKGTLLAVKAAKKMDDTVVPETKEHEDVESELQEKTYLKKLMKKLGVRP